MVIFFNFVGKIMKKVYTTFLVICKSTMVLYVCTVCVYMYKVLCLLVLLVSTSYINTLSHIYNI